MEIISFYYPVKISETDVDCHKVHYFGIHNRSAFDRGCPFVIDGIDDRNVNYKPTGSHTHFQSREFIVGCAGQVLPSQFSRSTATLYIYVMDIISFYYLVEISETAVHCLEVHYFVIHSLASRLTISKYVDVSFGNYNVSHNSGNNLYCPHHNGSAADSGKIPLPTTLYNLESSV